MNYQYKLLTALVSMQLFAMDGKDLWDVKACNASEDLASTTMNVKAYSSSADVVANASEEPCAVNAGMMEGPCASANGEQVDVVAHYLSQVEAVDTKSANGNTLPSLHERESASNAQNQSAVGAQEQVMAQRKRRQDELTEKIALQAAELRKLEQSDINDYESFTRSEVIDFRNIAFLSLQFKEIEDRADVAITLLFGVKNSLLHMHKIQNTDEPSQRQDIEHAYELGAIEWAIAKVLSKEEISVVSTIKSEEAKEWNDLYDSVNILNKVHRKECDKNNNDRFEKLEQMLLTLTEDKVAQQSRIIELEKQNAEQTKKAEELEKKGAERENELKDLKEQDVEIKKAVDLHMQKIEKFDAYKEAQDEHVEDREMLNSYHEKISALEVINDAQQKAIDSLVNNQEAKLAELKANTKEIVGLCMKALEEQTDKSVNLEEKYTAQSEKLEELKANTRDVVEMQFKKLADLESESKEVASSHTQKMEKQDKKLRILSKTNDEQQKAIEELDVRNISIEHDVESHKYHDIVDVAKLMLDVYKAKLAPDSYTHDKQTIESVIRDPKNNAEGFKQLVEGHYFRKLKAVDKDYFKQQKKTEPAKASVNFAPMFNIAKRFFKSQNHESLSDGMSVLETFANITNDANEDNLAGMRIGFEKFQLTEDDNMYADLHWATVVKIANVSVKDHNAELFEYSFAILEAARILGFCEDFVALKTFLRYSVVASCRIRNNIEKRAPLLLEKINQVQLDDTHDDYAENSKIINAFKSRLTNMKEHVEKCYENVFEGLFNLLSNFDAMLTIEEKIEMKQEASSECSEGMLEDMVSDC